MAEGDINGFDDRDTARIGEVVRFVEHSPRYSTRQRRWGGPVGLPIVCGVLTSAITAASPDGKTGATHFTFRIWRLNPADSSDPQQMIEDSDDTVGVNRSQRAYATGKFGEFVYADGEWRPLNIDCD